MKQRTGRKLFGFLLSLALVLGLMPGMCLTAYAATETYTNLIPTSSDTDLTSKQVTFNGYKWYIIADNSTAADAGTVTLLAADTSFGTSTFKSDNSSNSYNSSDVKAYLDNIVAGKAGEGKPNFKAVADAIQPVTLTTYKYASTTEVAETTENAKLYLLSTSEAGPYANFNFTGAQDGGWWLRSPGYDVDFAAFVRGEDGYVGGNGARVYKEFGVRPALKLDLSSVIFDSESKEFSLKPASTYTGFGGLITNDTEVTISEVSGKTWYVIACDDSTVTLLSKESFENKAFDSSGAGNDYATSEIKTYVDGLTGEGQPLAGISSVISDLTLIDITTAQGLTETKRKGAGTDWWLRSPGDNVNTAASVDGGPGVVYGTGNYVGFTLGVRPALKLNLSSVIFSSESNTFSLKPSHTHSFTYSASGATITATCGEDCDITTGLTLTISAPTGDLTADGTKTFPATLSSGYNTTAFPEGSISEISYAKDGTAFTGTPTEAGVYVAYVTVGEGEDAVTASVNYEIASPVASVTLSGGTTNEYTDFATALNFWTDGSTLKLLADVDTNSAITVNGTKTLDLNGHTLKTNGDTTVTGADVTLTIKDSGSGGKMTRNGTTGSLIWVKGGSTLILDSGTLEGHSENSPVVDFHTQASGNFTMNGGKITGTAKLGAVKLVNAATFTMTGGEISGVTTGTDSDGKSYGVINLRQSVANNPITLSGTAKIIGNQGINDTTLNIYLPSGKYITVNGAMSNTTPIGVTMATPGVFTNTLSDNMTYNDASKFVSDSTSYIVGKNADSQLLLGASYTVTYDANNGSGAPSDSTPYADGSSVTVLSKGSLARDGYDFAGWKIGTAETIYANSADNITGATEAFTITGNTTLTAQWTAIPATAPNINTQPQDLNLTYGYTEGSLGVTAAAATNTTYNGLTYQWYSNTTASNQGGTEITENGTSSTYTIPAGKTTGTTEYYYCVVTATRSDNGQTATATSSVATVTVNAALISSVTVTDITAPVGGTALDTDATTSTDNVTLGTVTWNPTTTPAAYATQYTATVIATAGTNYAFAETATATVNGETNTNVTKNSDGTLSISYTFSKTELEPVTITATDKEATYTADGIAIPVEGMFTIPNAAGDASYTVTAGTGTGTFAEGKLTVTKCGTFTVKVNTAATDTHAAAEKTATLTVKKAASSVKTVPIVKTLTYTGAAQELITAGEADGGTMKYAVTTENQAPAADAYTFDNTSIPTATNAGTYYVWYKVVGDANYFDVAARCIPVSIAKLAGTSAPAGLVGIAATEGGNDGQITGVTSDMEYAASADFSAPVTCSGTSVTGLSAGTYYVRAKETASHQAGAAATVTVPAQPHTHDGVTFNTWSYTDSLPNTAGAYCLVSDVELTTQWQPQADILLCLDGHTITVQANHDVIGITGHTLDLYDCANTGRITHAAGATGRGVYVNVGGTFNMHGGIISGNTAAGADGGGVHVNTEGTFNMHGGVISGNTAAGAGGGVYLTGSGTFDMSGGKIIGNTALYGSGVYFNAGTFNLSGSPLITGSEGSSTVYLDANCKITIIGELQNTTPIGITMAAPGVFTDGTNISYNAPARFRSDNDSYVIGKNNVEQLFVNTSPCTVSYDANNATGGTVPTDPNSPYVSGSRVTVLGNNGNLVRDGYTFDEWSLNADGTGDSYYNGYNFTIQSNTTLYARWKPIAASSPTITAEPQNLSLIYGYTEGSLSVTAAAPTDTAYTLSYQWYSCNFTGFEEQPISGATTGSYSIPAGKAAGTTEYYYCRITATRTDNGQTAYADSAIVQVQVAQKSVTVTAKPQLIADTGYIKQGADQATLAEALAGHTLYGVILTENRSLMNIVPSAAVIRDASDTDVTANYAVKYVPGTLTVRAKTNATFTLPQNARTIDESAFEGLTLMTAVDARYCTSIGANAFKGCTGLTQIQLPQNCSIHSSAFSGCGTVYVYAPSGGTTETYCDQYDNLIFLSEHSPK